MEPRRPSPRGPCWSAAHPSATRAAAPCRLNPVRPNPSSVAHPSMRALILHTASSVLRLVPESKTADRAKRERGAPEGRAAEGAAAEGRAAEGAAAEGRAAEGAAADGHASGGASEEGRHGYRLGLRAVMPLLPAVLAFGVSFGVLAQAAGMGASASIVMSLTTF